MTEHEDFQDLLGAYALDAVDPTERDEIERHLATCPRCRAEVAEHRLRVVPDGDGGRALADTRDPRFPDHHVTQPEDQCVPDT